MKPLKQIGDICDYNQLSFLLKDYKSPRDIITKLLKNNEILRVKKGLYIKSDYNFELLPILANLIYGPSYLSKEWALFYYRMIPEHVFELTSITSGKKKEFDTAVGRFTYQAVNQSYYPADIVRKSYDNYGSFLVASKEKCLCDLIYSKRLITIDDIAEFLKHSRIDADEFGKLSVEKIKSLALLSGKKSLKLLHQYLENQC